MFNLLFQLISNIPRKNWLDQVCIKRWYCRIICRL